MSKYFFAAVLLSVLFVSCIKKPTCEYDACATSAPPSEIQAIQNYLTNTGVTATQHCSGVFYQIVTEGTGKTPTPCSNIGITYKGMLTNGSVFEETVTPVYFNLGGLIVAWRNILPLVKVGGSVVLYIPPALGYGYQAYGSIPPNSILIFEIDLLDVQ